MRMYGACKGQSNIPFRMQTGRADCLCKDIEACLLRHSWTEITSNSGQRVRMQIPEEGHHSIRRGLRICVPVTVTISVDTDALHIEYFPVCCEPQGGRKPFTASNECFCTNFETGSVLYPGECKKKTSPPPVCTKEYFPVCCDPQDVGKPFTAGNECECGTGTILYPGECKPSLPPPPPFCTLELAPVCCRPKGKTKPFTAGNKCTCGTGVVLPPGKCNGVMPTTN